MKFFPFIGEHRKMTVPIHVATLYDIAQVVCGFFHTLAFDKKGQRLYIWGCNPQILRQGYRRSYRCDITPLINKSVSRILFIT